MASGPRSARETTLAEVARAAGVTRTVLYHYFPSKELLTCAVIEIAADELLGELTPSPSEIRSIRAGTRLRVMAAVGALLAPDLSAAGLSPSDARAVLAGEMTVGALAAAGRWRRAHPDMPLDEFAATIYDLLWLGTRGYTDHAS